MIRYVYDNTFEGLLTVVFESFFSKKWPQEIVPEGTKQETLFANNLTVISSVEKAERVLAGLLKKGSKLSLTRIFKAFHYEGEEMLIFRYIKLIVTSDLNMEENYSEDSVLKIKQIEKQIDREVHRMHAFVRFQKSSDEIFYSSIEPDFNVIPLLSDHFKRRYADQKWMIYDTKRNLGIYYDLKEVQEVKGEITTNEEAGNLELAQKETEYQSLWKNYFDSVNIKERKNLKLHIRHVPKRYWKHLIEKKL